jgi:hypothetical protein
MRATTHPRRLAISVLEDNPERLSRQLVDPPSSLHCRALSESKTTLAEANSFPCGCQPFCCIPIGLFRVRWTRVSSAPGDPGFGVVSRKIAPGRGQAGALRQARFDQAKARQYPQTVARKSAIRLRPRNVWGPRRPAAELPLANRRRS